MSVRGNCVFRINRSLSDLATANSEVKMSEQLGPDSENVVTIEKV